MGVEDIPISFPLESSNKLRSKEFLPFGWSWTSVLHIGFNANSENFRLLTVPLVSSMSTKYILMSLYHFEVRSLFASRPFLCRFFYLCESSTTHFYLEVEVTKTWDTKRGEGFALLHLLFDWHGKKGYHCH